MEQADKTGILETIRQLRSIAVQSLEKMYRPNEKMFAFRMKRNGAGGILQGISTRYTAITLIGLEGESENTVKRVLCGHTLSEVCENLISNIDRMKEPGELALTTWATRRLEHPGVEKCVDALRRLCSFKKDWPSIELSWALAALVIGSKSITDMSLAQKLAEILMDSFSEKTEIFLHGASRKGLSSLFSHVSCFADFVYPIQALSYYYQASQDKRAADMACRCAKRMCELQGDNGQWWWHYDVRTGRVLERYPVYSVHQHAMAPMALSALTGACGRNYSDAVEKSLGWLIRPSEIPFSLIDTEHNVIWRKVARRETFRLVRKMQAAASSIHSSFRAPGMDFFFPPVSVDYECRPYEMGWLLYAWPEEKVTGNL